MNLLCNQYHSLQNNHGCFHLVNLPLILPNSQPINHHCSLSGGQPGNLLVIQPNNDQYHRADNQRNNPRLFQIIDLVFNPLNNQLNSQCIFQVANHPNILSICHLHSPSSVLRDNQQRDRRPVLLGSLTGLQLKDLTGTQHIILRSSQ